MVVGPHGLGICSGQMGICTHYTVLGITAICHM